MRIFQSVDGLADATGQTIGPSEWMTVTQSLISNFAELTEDRQWIHLDVDRAARSQFGGTVAHGYLLESLIPRFSAQLLTIDGTTAGVNIGSDKVRFLHPVLAGSRIRAHAQIRGVERRESGTRVAIRFEYELEGADTPAMVADTVRIVTT